MWDAGPDPCSAFPSSAFSNPSIWNFLFKWLNFPLGHLPSLRNTSTKESATFTLPLVLSPPSFLSLKYRTLVFNFWASQQCPSPPCTSCTKELTGASQTRTCGFYCSESAWSRPEASHCNLHWGSSDWKAPACWRKPTGRAHTQSWDSPDPKGIQDVLLGTTEVSNVQLLNPSSCNENLLCVCVCVYVLVTYNSPGRGSKHGEMGKRKALGMWQSKEN